MKITVKELKNLIRESVQEQLRETAVGDEAKKKGLKHVGHGHYADKAGKIVAVSQNGKLVPIKAKAAASEKSAVSKQPEKKEVNIFDKPEAPKEKSSPLKSIVDKIGNLFTNSEKEIEKRGAVTKNVKGMKITAAKNKMSDKPEYAYQAETVADGKRFTGFGKDVKTATEDALWKVHAKGSFLEDIFGHR